MTELLIAAEMRTIEQAAIDRGEVSGRELMERAGRGAVDAIFDEWPELAKGFHHAVVLCGPGNNGGDGFVIARRLRDKGWKVEVLLFGDPEKLPPDAKANYEIWLGMGEVAELTVDAASSGSRPVLLIDAMFGTGLSRAIPLDCANAYHAVEKRGVGDKHPWLVPYYTVAVDCPSGLDCDSGLVLLPEPPSDDAGHEEHWDWWQNEGERRLLNPKLCVTFHRRKVGHYLGNNLFRLKVVDIGLGKEDRHPAHLLSPRSAETVCLLDFERRKGPSQIWPRHILKKSEFAHKYEHGHAIVLSGGRGHSGAARLAARAALRIGAGLVTVGAPDEAMSECAAKLTAIMLREVETGEALAAVLEDERLNAICIGPGLGVNARGAELVRACLEAKRPTLLDADALGVLFFDEADALFNKLHNLCVLTPHGGEFARLFPDIAEKLDVSPVRGPAFSKVDAAREAAKRAGCAVLLKGPDTVIAAPDGRCSINSARHDRAAPWLATAGSGDVLAGFITGLLARRVDPMAAAEIAAWVHVECARAFGPGLIAEDLPDILPQVLAQLGERGV